MSASQRSFCLNPAVTLQTGGGSNDLSNHHCRLHTGSLEISQSDPGVTFPTETLGPACSLRYPSMHYCQVKL